MSTTTVSLDTNVVIALFNQDQALNKMALAAIERSRKTGRLVVCGPVYSELFGLPARTQPFLDAFFSAGGIELDWGFDEEVWREAGDAFQGYVERRVASTGLAPRRILADFLIGAHALVRGYSLLTIDFRHFRAAFPSLPIINM